MSKRENFSKQANAAVLAIMQHAVDHDLPPVLSVDVYRGVGRVNVRVAEGHEAWLNSLMVLGEQNESAERVAPAWWRTDFQVQLPVGVVFDLIVYRGQPLSAVSA